MLLKGLGTNRFRWSLHYKVRFIHDNPFFFTRTFFITNAHIVLNCVSLQLSIGKKIPSQPKSCCGKYESLLIIIKNFCNFLKTSMKACEWSLIAQKKKTRFKAAIL